MYLILEFQFQSLQTPNPQISSLGYLGFVLELS
jgi:hypothetical protein